MDDDLGGEVPLPRPPRRVVSLVPSLTEAIAATAPGLLVGATDWCTHPAGLAVTRVRGTKNPDLAAIRGLAPDLVVANREENRKLDVERLRASGVAVWVTSIDTVEQALTSLDRLFAGALGLGRPGWLDAAAATWAAPPTLPPLRVAVAIWRDPWMWIGPRSYGHDVLQRLGLVNAVTEPRYPHVDPDSAALADLVLLPDEPYPFTADDGPEVLPVPSRLISGRSLSWYGPAMVDGRGDLERALA